MSDFEATFQKLTDLWIAQHPKRIKPSTEHARLRLAMDDRWLTSKQISKAMGKLHDFVNYRVRSNPEWFDERKKPRKTKHGRQFVRELRLK